MATKCAKALCATVGFLFLIGLALPQVYGSSNLSFGKFDQQNLADGLEKDRGYCSFFTSPHEDQYGFGRFLMFIADTQASDGDELELTGEFETNDQGKYTLYPDDDSAEAFLQRVFGSRIGVGNLDVNLFKLEASIEAPVEGSQNGTRCRVSLVGNSITDSNAFSPVRLSFMGEGRHYKGALSDSGDELLAAATASVSSFSAEQAACDNPRQSDWFGYDPAKICGGNNCLLDFAGYKWWTGYHYRQGSGFWHNDFKQSFSPRNVRVDSDGLHLLVRKDDLGGPDGLEWAASEVVLAQYANGNLARLGYGTYLVAARVVTASSWNQLDRNVAFGVFTYDFVGNGTDNPNRELDLAEVSRWGHEPGTSCDIDPRLCPGNAQFAVQRWDAIDDNLHRYEIAQGTNEITLVMEWKDAQQPVTFKQYNALYNTIQALPDSPDYQWTTSGTQNRYIPDPGCQFFHMNFWMGNFKRSEQAGVRHPPPSNGQDQEIVVTAFEYTPR